MRNQSSFSEVTVSYFRDARMLWFFRQINLHNELHWLDVPQRVIFKLCMTVYKCLHGFATQYLAELCESVADVPGRRHLRSASRGLLNYPRYNLSNYGWRAFSHAGPYYWNFRPYNVRDSVSITSFKRALKTFLFR